jgi:hypothetical protein
VLENESLLLERKDLRLDVDRLVLIRLSVLLRG